MKSQKVPCHVYHGKPDVCPGCAACGEKGYLVCDVVAPPVQRKQKPVTMTLDDETITALRSGAAANGLGVSAYVRMIVRRPCSWCGKTHPAQDCSEWVQANVKHPTYNPE